eukprot:TRINITY_DN93_c0_g2_i1.p2 TRINITY_DN93_c0_g2~~TRINITY_DN93_c0_g2_i1.p2  ORF type:complete len:529 (+),score=205.93 TRINITY_DN93_c0_g2_i1:84-1589(+)
MVDVHRAVAAAYDPASQTVPLRPTALGSGADPAAVQLSERLCWLFDDHLQQRGTIDNGFAQLGQEEKCRRAAEDIAAASTAKLSARRHAAERAAEAAAGAVASLEQHLAVLEREREEADRARELLLEELKAADERRSLTGAAVAADDGAEDLRLAAQVAERDHELSLLEDRLLQKEAMRIDRRRSLGEAERAHAELQAARGALVSGEQGRRELARQQADALRQSLAEEQSRLAARQAEVGAVAAEREGAQQRLRTLSAVRDALQSDLRESRDALREAEAELQWRLAHYGRPDVAPQWSAVPDEAAVREAQVVRLQEVMMLLKAEVISLELDYVFIGRLCEQVSAQPAEGGTLRGLRAFTDAFRYVRATVELLNGPQPGDARWHPNAELGKWQPVPLESVEGVLSALKQLAVCWDMMPDSAKQQVHCSGEIVRNSSVLVALAQEAVVKYAELERAREAEDADEQEWEAERKRLREERRKTAIRARLLELQQQSGSPPNQRLQ